MAETRRQNKIISKGSKHPVTIEEAIEDALVVCLDYGARKYRGILLDTNKRNLPHGLCSRFKPNGENALGVDGSAVEAPATYFRHTYMQNDIKHNEVVQVKNVQKDKNTRQHIRLRPRQMLCNKCKAMCQETDKGIVPITAVSKQNTKPENIKTSSPLKEGLRRRSSCQNLKEDNSNTDSMSKTNRLDKTTDKSHLINTRASPFIKINIGAGTVLKIPPRLHGDEVDGISKKDAAEQVSENMSDDSLSSHRKVKKLKAKDRDKDTEEEVKEVDNDEMSEMYHHKKHKRKHKRKHEDETKLITDNSDGKYDENGDNIQYCDTNQQTIMSQRPRLLYTWRQNKGLSPRRDIDNTYNIKMSPQQNVQNFKKLDLKPRKEYRLRSREKSVEDVSEYVSSDNSQTSMSESEDNAILSSESGDEHITDKLSTSDDVHGSSVDENEDDEEAEGPPADENIEVLRPLMMKIQTRDVPKCIKTDGRTVHVGDIVWGKIKGFPWWPGRVLSITVSTRESGIVLRQLAHLAWFGSSTMSHIQCSDLYPFLEDFKLRYNKKKRGPYKMAIKQATIAAQSLTNTHHIDFTEFDL